jgi:S1-C subfamily serine protease
VPLGGDIILSVQGVPFTAANAQKIRDTLNQMAPGAPITVTILRAGDVLELTGRAR